MPFEPSHLRYSLSRRQRLAPLLHEWGRVFAVFVVVMWLFFAVNTVIAVFMLSGLGVATFGFLTLVGFALHGRLLVGLVDVVLNPSREMDVVLEETAVGVMMGGERWYLFLDGFTGAELIGDVWVFQHLNGRQLHIAASAISEEQLAHIRAAMERGKTPEGIQAVIERGKRIAEITGKG